MSYALMLDSPLTLYGSVRARQYISAPLRPSRWQATSTCLWRGTSNLQHRFGYVGKGASALDDLKTN
jgi:hypothetical protein